MTDNITLLMRAAKRSDDAAQGVRREHYSHYRNEAFVRRKMAREAMRVENGQTWMEAQEDN